MNEIMNGQPHSNNKSWADDEIDELNKSADYHVAEMNDFECEILL